MVNVSEMMKQAEADLKKAETALAAAQERANEMRAVWEWLNRHGHAEERIIPKARSAEKPAAAVPQTDLCLRVLTELGRPAATKEIRERLEREGSAYNQQQIRSALKYLARKDKIESAGAPGVWQLPAASTPAAAFVPSGATANGSGASYER